ncbi:MAG: carboxylating nicotinate-nucleotide diphosphorylase [Candidatus Omnitrophota bacterium]
MNLDQKKVDAIIRSALKEDIGKVDITSKAVISRSCMVDGVIISRQKAVICGMDIIERIFTLTDKNLKFRPEVKDGDIIVPDQRIACIEGSAVSLLKAERTALNFLAFLSGTATAAREIADKVKDSNVKVYDTRKTVPLNRYFQKYAVRVGGGINHRQGLWDMVLIKDNHIRAFEMQNKNKEQKDIITGIIQRARASVQKNIRIEIEVESLKECEYALEACPDVIMLDNMNPGQIRKAVELRKQQGLEKKVLFEVSGGITLANVSDYADTGIDIISTGSITASVKSVDFSLKVIFK